MFLKNSFKKLRMHLQLDDEQGKSYFYYNLKLSAKWCQKKSVSSPKNCLFQKNLMVYKLIKYLIIFSQNVFVYIALDMSPFKCAYREPHNSNKSSKIHIPKPQFYKISQLWTASQPFIFVNRILLKQRHVYSLTYCVWLLS